MTLLMFLLVFIIVYVVPACVSFWRVFLAIWLSVGALLIAFWWNTEFSTNADPLARMFDQAIFYSLAGLWFTAGIVQTIRAWANSKEWKNKYYHWPVVVIGGVAATLLSATYFVH